MSQPWRPVSPPVTSTVRLLEPVGTMPPASFISWWEAGLLDLQQLRELLPDAWTPDNPVRDLGEQRWLEQFVSAGVVVEYPAGYPKDRRVNLEEPVEVYRGAPDRTKGRGMPWSADLAKAQWFADRWASRGVSAGLYRAVIPPEAVLAVFFDGRNESEVVVNPNKLRGRVERVGSGTAAPGPA